MSDTTFNLIPISKAEYSSKELEGIEDGRNRLQYNLILYVGVAFVGIFTLVSFYKGRFELGLYLLGCLGLVGLVHLFVRKTNNIALAAIFYALVMSALVIFLFISGGVSGTGPLWSYPIIALMIPLLGYLKGFVFSLVLITIIALLMWLAPQGLLFEYPVDFNLRYLSTLTALSLLTSAIEYSRGKAFSFMLFLSNELESVSRTDPLTGLMNRRGIDDIFKKEVNRFERKGTQFSVLLIDVDDFKQINDSHGHSLGDAVLKELAQVMLRNLRHMDTVSRWGGEEFLVLLPETTADQAQVVAEKLCQCVDNASPLCDGYEHRTTISIGVATYHQVQELLGLADIADKALYKAKQRGKNCAVNARELHVVPSG